MSGGSGGLAVYALRCALMRRRRLEVKHPVGGGEAECSIYDLGAEWSSAGDDVRMQQAACRGWPHYRENGWQAGGNGDAETVVRAVGDHDAVSLYFALWHHAPLGELKGKW